MKKLETAGIVTTHRN